MQTDTNGPHNTAILCRRIARLRNGRGLTTGPLTGPLGPPSEASTAEGSPARTHRQRTDGAPTPLAQSRAATRATAPLLAGTYREGGGTCKACGVQPDCLRAHILPHCGASRAARLVCAVPVDTAPQKARPMDAGSEYMHCRMVHVKERVAKQQVMVCKDTSNASSSSQQHLWWQLWRRTAGRGAKNEANGYQPMAGQRSSQQTSANEQLRQCCSHCGAAATFQHGTACDASGCSCSCRVR